MEELPEPGAAAQHHAFVPEVEGGRVVVHVFEAADCWCDVVGEGGGAVVGAYLGEGVGRRPERAGDLRDVLGDLERQRQQSRGFDWHVCGVSSTMVAKTSSAIDDR